VRAGPIALQSAQVEFDPEGKLANEWSQKKVAMLATQLAQVLRVRVGQ